MDKKREEENPKVESVNMSRRNIFRTGGAMVAAGLVGGLVNQGAHARGEYVAVVDPIYYPVSNHVGDVSVSGQTQ